MRFTLLLLPDAEVGGYAVLVPALGIATMGDTVAEAMAMAQEAITLYLESQTPAEAEAEPYRHGEPAGTAVVTIEVPELGEHPSDGIGVRPAEVVDAA
jgi:predicted RNase H-like HicB family nuclease